MLAFYMLKENKLCLRNFLKNIFCNSRKEYKSDKIMDLVVSTIRSIIMVVSVTISHNVLSKKNSIVDGIISLIETIIGICWIAH